MEHLNHSSSNTSGMSLKQNANTGVLGVCFLLGAPANIAVVVFLLRQLKKNNFTHHLMLNLAVSDILRLVSLPLWMYNVNFAWALGRAVCKLLFLVSFASGYTSILTVTLMSVQRYVVVLHRGQWAKLGRKGEHFLLLCLWMLGLTLSSHAAVKAELIEGGNEVCRRSIDENTLLGILMYETLVGFVLPFIVMAVFYFCLHKKVKETPFFSCPRLTKLVIAILFGFLVLWMPFHVMNLVRFFGIALRSSNPLVSQRLQSVWNSGHGIAKTLSLLNSCVNPLLYAWSFRKRPQNPEESKGNFLTRFRLNQAI